MKKFLKNLLIFILLFTIINVNAKINTSFLENPTYVKSGEKAAKVHVKSKSNLKLSSWALYDINDSEFFGLYPIDKIKKGVDFKKNISLDDIEDLYMASKNKLSSLQISINEEDFEFKNLSRDEIIESILYLLKKDDSYKKNFYYGSNNETYLKEKISLQESLCLYTRAVRKIINEENRASQGYFYKINNGENTVYLLGSIHLGITEMYPVKNEIIEALKKSSRIYFEIDSTDSNISKIYEDNMYYQGKGSLKEDVGDIYDNIKILLIERGIHKEEIDKIRPWAVYNILSTDGKNNYGPTLGVENYFLSLSLMNNIKIDQLESAKYQADLLQGFDKNKYVLLINELIKEVEKNGYININKGLYNIQKDWINAKEDLFNKAITGDEGSSVSKEYDKMLLNQRDINMANKIDKILKNKKEKTVFIVIGAAHLVPENSVIGILKDMGYRVE